MCDSWWPAGRCVPREDLAARWGTNASTKPDMIPAACRVGMDAKDRGDLGDGEHLAVGAGVGGARHGFLSGLRVVIVVVGASRVYSHGLVAGGGVGGLGADEVHELVFEDVVAAPAG